MLKEPLFYFKVCSLIGFLFLSVLVMGSFIGKSSVLSGYGTYSIAKAADGHVKRPFVGRMLLPQFSNVVAHFTPHSWKKAVSDAVRPVPDMRIMQRTFGPYNKFTVQRVVAEGEPKGPRHITWTDHNVFRSVVALVAFYACMLVYGASLYNATKHFFPGRPWLACLMPIYGLLLYHGFSNHKAHIYDIPQLMLFSLMLLAMHKEKWVHYFVLFVFACLNKETAVLMLGVFVLFKYKEFHTARFWQLLLLQAAIWVTCYVGIQYVLFDSNRMWRYFPVMNVLGLELRYFNLGSLYKYALAWFLLTSCWEEIPDFLKKALSLLPALIVLYLIFGFHREYRVLFEAFPVVTLITGYTLFSRLDTRLSARRT